MKKLNTLLLYLLVCLSLEGQTLGEASHLSQLGSYEDAEEVFTALEENSSKIESDLWLARAYNFSWWGKYDLAEPLFKKLLITDKDDLDALVGLAYNTAWKGERDNAVHLFQKAIDIDPENRSAWFGMAYNYLEKDNVQGTRSTLEELRKILVDDPEYYLLEGLLAIKELKNKKAVKNFRLAIEKDSSLTLAREKLDQFESIPAKWAISLWHGSTVEQGKVKHSFRRFDIVFQPTDDILLYGGYDNTLVLQNSFLRISEGQAPFFFVGGKYSFSEKLFAKLEVGQRRFNNLPDQWIVSLENTYFFHHKFILNGILIFDNRKFEQLLTAGINVDIGISNNFRTSLAYFRNQNLNKAGLTSNRLMVSPKILLGKSEINLGYFYDKNQITDQLKDDFHGYFGLFSFPIVRQLDGRILYHKDVNTSQQNSALFSLGLTLKL